MRIQNRGIYFLLALIGIGIILQIGAATQKNYWLDEAWTSRVVRLEYDKVIDATTRDRHPPLYFLSTALWGRFAGYSEAALRLPSILFTVLTFILVFYFANEVFDRRVAFISLLLLVFSPFVVTYGYNARYYAMSAAIGLFVVISLYKYINSSRIIFLITYIISSVILLYTVYTGVTLILACNIWWLWQWKRSQGSNRQLFAWLISQAIVVLLFLPWLPALQATVVANVNTFQFTPAWLGELVKSTAYLGMTFGIGESISPLNPVAWIGIILTIFLLSYAIFRHEPDFWILPTFLIIISTINILLSSIAVYPVSGWQGIPNRIFYAFPFFVMWIAYAITKLNARGFVFAIGLLLAVFILGTFHYFTNQQLIKPHLAVPWREIFEYIQSEAQDDMVVVCDHVDLTCSFYAKEYDLPVYSSKQWKKMLEETPGEIWWIHVNVGFAEFEKDRNVEALNTIDSLFGASTVQHYTPHDESILWLKQKILKQVDYKHRVIVYRFFDRTEP